jgi:hypothetical protein
MVAMKLFDSERRVTEAAERLARPPTRYSARKVRCATSRYLSRDDGRPRAVTAITATTPPLDPPGSRPRPRPHSKNPARTGAQPPTRRQRVIALMTTSPRRDRSGREFAERLQIKPRNLHTQLGEWAKLGFITRTGFAICALNTPAARTSSTTTPDP